ncbi:MAG: FmdB family zinc ribbon protein [Candidatus Rokuibacteriota bacterium]
MPTYEYECDQCHRTFEVRQRITAEPLTRCEACGGTLRRLIAPAPFILKGEGWYVTDYPSEARKKAVESEKSSAGKSTSGEQSSTPAPKETPTTPSSSAAAPSSPAATSSD